MFILKKKILIVNKSFAIGGIQTSLNNMLEEIKDSYDIDLLVFYDKGPLREKVPKGINIIEPSMLVKTLGMSMNDLKYCKNPIKIIFRSFAAVWTKIFSNSLPISMALMTQKKLKGYDVAISFHQEAKVKNLVSGFNRFIIRCVESPMKIGWVHADVVKGDLVNNQIKDTYFKLDKLVCVSDSALESLISSYPELKDKSSRCYNFHPYDEILRKSNEYKNLYNKNDEIVLFSACRLSKEKGLKRAINPIRELIKEGYKIKWYIAGDGSERENLTKEIRKHALEDTVFLLGPKSNPYPYIKEADLLFISSYHEAAPMVVDEAKIIGTPIFSTDIQAVREKINEEFNFICENSEKGIYIGLKKLLNNPEQISKAKNNYLVQDNSNEKSKIFFRAVTEI
ncbi:glycosyltransferase [Planococcus sp. X10-3]|uniref:glycosyltransferase n=1 Tax=Planococcus sp. X10-3 TaxID=3061240 RepID=UPI003BB0DBDF